MSCRRLIPGLWVVAVLTTLACVGQASAVFDVPESRSPTVPELVYLVRYEIIGEGYYLVWPTSDDADRAAPLPAYEDDYDTVNSWIISTGISVEDASIDPSSPSTQPIAKNSPFWEIQGLKTLPWPFRRLVTPTVVHFSAEQERQINGALNVGTHPVVTLISTESSRRVEVTDIAWSPGFSFTSTTTPCDWHPRNIRSDDTYSPGFSFHSPHRDGNCPKVEIGEVRVGEVAETADEPETKPDDAPILPLFEGDGFSPANKSTFFSGGHSDLAYGPHYPQMLPDSPNWVIPGVLATRLAFRPIESPMASHDGAEYVFAKPNGEMIVVKSTIIPWGD